MCKNFIENYFAGIEFVLYLQPALKNNRVVLRKVNQKILEGHKRISKKNQEKFARNRNNRLPLHSHRKNGCSEKLKRSLKVGKQ
jgi:hypothetical protein